MMVRLFDTDRADSGISGDLFLGGLFTHGGSGVLSRNGEGVHVAAPALQFREAALDFGETGAGSPAARFSATTPGGSLASPLPTYTYDQIATYLESGFWTYFGGAAHKFNMGSTGVGANNGVLLYNVNSLTSAGAFLAEEALKIYETVTGIDFVRTSSTTGVDLTFTDDFSGAYSNYSYYTGTNTTASANVNVSTAWLSTYGTGFGTYSFQTYLHEIGHALGLGHSGAYNGFVNFVSDTTDPDYGNNSNIYLNDSWQASMMSYISQDQPFVNADFAFLISPMISDWIALGRMYGTGGAGFAGDTTWGFNTNISSTSYAQLATYAASTAFTIIDRSGIDTVDFSGYSSGQSINLNAGAASSIGGLTGNMMIAANTLIENAVGGAGADTLTGNTAANRLTGGGGNDTLNGGAGGDSLYGDAGGDRMSGNDGSDFYYVDSTLDQVIESTSGAAGGTDIVYSRVSFTLGTNVESLRMIPGSGTVNGTGNSGDNELWGTSAVNTLRGLGGADSFDSGNGADIVIGGTGADLFKYSVDIASNPSARDIIRAGDGAVAFEAAGAGAGDRFDFRTFDANTGVSGTQHFAFGTSTGVARLWAVNSGTNTLIRGNIDADSTVEFELSIEDGSVLASAYSSADFLLA